MDIPTPSIVIGPQQGISSRISRRHAKMMMIRLTTIVTTLEAKAQEEEMTLLTLSIAERVLESVEISAAMMMIASLTTQIQGQVPPFTAVSSAKI